MKGDGKIDVLDFLWLPMTFLDHLQQSFGAPSLPPLTAPRLARLLDRHRHWDLVVGGWAGLWHGHIALLVNVLWHLARRNVKTGQKTSGYISQK